MATEHRAIPFATGPDAVAELESIEVGGVGAAILRDSPGGKLDATSKGKLIEAIRAGQHVELAITAVTFRQRDGSPNKNHLRFKTSKLGDIAASFVGKPALLDHDKHSQAARIGTIEASELAPLPGGWAGFRQTMRIVKPHAVISVLDGTIDRFSIGWDPSGAVICTAHKVDVRGPLSCYFREDCYPGKLVEVDGESQIAEYEWQSTEGLETSGVNTPAVSGTKIENVRAALAAELQITERKDPPMLSRLAAALAITGVTTLTDADEARACEVVADLKTARLAAEQERDVGRVRITVLETELAAAHAATAAAAALATASKVDAMLEAAYRSGKLLYQRDESGKAMPSLREPRLRRIATRDGIDELAAELSELPVIAPINQRELAAEDPMPRAALRGTGHIPTAVLESTAKQLGLKVEDLQNTASALAGGRE